MTKNFADQPTFHSGVQANDVISAKDFRFANITNDGMFLKNPIFVDNCKDCGMNTKMNADGFGLDDVVGLAEFGVKTWSDDQQRQSQENQANLALQIEEQKRQLAQIQAQADITKAQSQASIVKSYALPIAIGGGVIILGIATYFLVKR